MELMKELIKLNEAVDANWTIDELAAAVQLALNTLDEMYNPHVHVDFKEDRVIFEVQAGSSVSKALKPALKRFTARTDFDNKDRQAMDHTYAFILNKKLTAAEVKQLNDMDLEAD